MALLACLPALRSARAASYPATVAAMQSARETETNVYYHYTEFGRRAQQEGYRGIAYLFTAFAASEQVHATSFGKILKRLNVELAPIPKPAVRVGSTRENLIRAADSEISSIETFYPKLLEQLKPEGHEEAITLVRYAWSSEQQHRDKVRQIQRWTGTFFETVARTIDEKTGRYFVCQIYNNLYEAGLTDGKALPAKMRELIAIGILAYRGLNNAVYEHSKRALRLGATKQELLEAIETAAVPGGGPTLAAGLQALVRIEEDEKKGK